MSFLRNSRAIFRNKCSGDSAYTFNYRVEIFFLHFFFDLFLKLFQEIDILVTDILHGFDIILFIVEMSTISDV